MKRTAEFGRIQNRESFMAPFLREENRGSHLLLVFKWFKLVMRELIKKRGNLCGTFTK